LNLSLALALCFGLFDALLPLYPFAGSLVAGLRLTTSSLPIYHPTTMARSSELADLFRQHTLVAHRNYEICKAYFLDETSAEQLATRFSLHPDSVRAVVRDFAEKPDLEQFFVVKHPGRQGAPKRDELSDEIVRLRGQGLTLPDIQEELKGQGHTISESYLSRILARQGSPTLPAPGGASATAATAKDGSIIPDVADVRSLRLPPGRCFRSKAAGLFLFVPVLLALDLPQAIDKARWPGSAAIPPLQAILALLTAKLLGKRRISHISDLCNDEGVGLFSGLNVLPKNIFSTDYSYRTERAMSERFIDALLSKVPLGEAPHSFNLDFHTIPFRGEDADLERHWLATRNRAGVAVMAFIAQQTQRRIMCYATANVLRAEADQMAVRFADHWKAQTGKYPAQLLFDGRVTTYAQLNELERREIGFITIRRRGCGMLRRLGKLSGNTWRSCQVLQAKGQKRRIEYVDEQTRLTGYEGTVRQIIVRGLGREEPTFFLTNDRPARQTAREVVQTYARRNLVENGLGEQITFFHLDCLSSDVRLNVDFDLTLTVAADLLYRELARRLKGFEQASPQKLFRKFVDTMGVVQIDEDKVKVRLDKRAHNPLLKEAGLLGLTPPVPWLANRPVLLDLL
jgi:transposase